MPSRFVRHALAAVLAAALALVLACEKGFTAGGPCPPEVPTNAGFCVDSTSFLLCDSNRRLANAPVKCKGPKGCAGTLPGKLKDICDISGNTKGDSCVVTGGAKACDLTDRACSADNKSLIVCGCSKPAKFEVIPCLGPKGCYADASGTATCDNRTAKEGDFCDPVAEPQSLFACTDDKRTMLGCLKDKEAWAPARTCRGPSGCVSKGVEADCDSTIAEAGDPCEADGMPACTADREASLECKNAHFAEMIAHCKNPCEARKIGHTFDVTCELRDQDRDAGKGPK
jgi:hypothetical protein